MVGSSTETFGAILDHLAFWLLKFGPELTLFNTPGRDRMATLTARLAPKRRV